MRPRRCARYVKRPARRAESGARLVGAGQRAAPPGLDHLDDGRAADRRLLVTHGQLRIGDIIAFTGFATLLISRLDQMSAFANQIFEARAKLEDFYQLEDSAADRARAGRPARARPTSPATSASRMSASSFPNSRAGRRRRLVRGAGRPDRRHRRPDRRRQDDADQPAAARLRRRQQAAS